MGLLDIIKRPSGTPGVQPTQPPIEDSGAVIALQAAQAPRIGAKDVEKAISTLKKYKDGKANLERRIIENELWYKLRHWEVMRSSGNGLTVGTDALGNTGVTTATASNGAVRPEPASAYLFNVITNKHADAMDNYPEVNVLPRERSDEQDAKMLSAILPVVLERSGFEDTYSVNWWEKLKHGTAVYGHFWNQELENGLGDIDIQSIDLLNIFWEPGITDIQDSRNLFIVGLHDNDLLAEQYPQLKGKLGGTVIDVSKYIHDDTVDTSDKSLVVDWYYKVKLPSGKKQLHFAKFVPAAPSDKALLYASENDPDIVDGWYMHGEYPVVFDTLFPEKGTPVGFGFIAVAKDPQLYIDKLGQNIMESAIIHAKQRYFVVTDTGINEDEFLDISKPIVHVQGQSLDERKLMAIQNPDMPSDVFTAYTAKIEEMKETSANRDFSQGSTGGGVTAASAIAALQEAGNKVSRDMIAASYRAYTKGNYMDIELMRQNYDEARNFRIVGSNADYQFISYSNANLKEQPLPSAYPGEAPMFRRPVFDIKLKASRKSPFSRASQNELAKELYGAGFFNPERAQEALGALELMDFEGKDKVLERVVEGQTMYNLVRQMAAQMEQMSALLGAPVGTEPADGKAPDTTSSGGVNTQASKAQTGSTDYQTALAKRSKPDMNALNGGKTGA
jgi:hypothetical protein